MLPHSGGRDGRSAPAPRPGGRVGRRVEPLRPRPIVLALLATLLLLAALGRPAGAQANSPAQPAAPAPPEPESQGGTASSEQPPPIETPDQGDQSGERAPQPFERFLPRLDVFFPEGELDLRINRLIHNVFFEGQVKYNFVSGDITAFLRYRYYGFRRTTQLAVFDQINFGQIQKLTTVFDRTRGVLVFMQWPHSYHYRTFALAEVDRISTNRQRLLAANNRTNSFLRIGYQVGSSGDERSSAIVGETRAHTPAIFTAVREIGPSQAGFTGALTYGFKLGVGDFDYVKIEMEGLKRFDLTASSFVVGRLHFGSFAVKELAQPGAAVPEMLYAIPLGEFFNLGGLDNLKGVSRRLIGTEEAHNTWELFFPWFLGQQRDFLHLEWQNWYWILYAGVGTLGFGGRTFTDFRSYVPDTGLGFESSVRLGKYRFFLAGILARPLKGGAKRLVARLSVKSFR
ncbi:MAG TPA: hypothetical protein VHR45_22070 [Thermoanaerobaculia bacterium]|nr:hypothetical protein [Thermoanaerobaculia bacterium]